MAEKTQNLHLRIVSIRGKTFDEEVYEVILPAETGQITVFPDHEPLVTLLSPGVARIRNKKSDLEQSMRNLAIFGGVVEIRDNKIVILSDDVEMDEEISEQEAEKAYENAMKAASEVTEQIALAEAKRVISYQRARLRVAELRRRKRG